MAATKPTFDYEFAAQERGFLRVAGLDEVGRGPLAGPVVAAAVVLNPDNIPDGLNDSKQVSVKRRNALYDELLEVADVSIAQASVREIEEENILRASHIAMLRALTGLNAPANFALIDGNKIPRGMNLPAETLVKGDTRSLSIAAASIVAKVWRDRLMVDLAQQHPGYGWERNAGYPTKEHKAGLKSHGVTPHHRRTFAPVHNMLWQAKNLTD
jgi:ribonuclease HII